MSKHMELRAYVTAMAKAGDPRDPMTHIAMCLKLFDDYGDILENLIARIERLEEIVAQSRGIN